MFQKCKKGVTEIQKSSLGLAGRRPTLAYCIKDPQASTRNSGLFVCLSSCRKWPNTLPPSDCIHRWNPFPEQTRKRSWRGILSPTRLLHSWHRVLLWLALNFCTEFYQVQVHVNRRSIEAMNGKDLLHLYIAHLFWYAPAFKKLPLFPFFTLVEVMRITGSPNFS